MRALVRFEQTQLFLITEWFEPTLCETWPGKLLCAVSLECYLNKGSWVGRTNKVKASLSPITYLDHDRETARLRCA